MKDIILLDNKTIDKIAAGEVVENPASIVKELIENSMDSGATSITVEIKNGGIEFLRVTDNGSGISKDNIPKAFLRHATSKITSIDDLFTIKSMGFRGEALASISSVAKVELITKERDSLIGSRYVIEGSVEKEFEEVGAPNGTSIIVRNLFYNTPARRKFLKSESTEAGYIADIIQNLALCRPDISFSFINNGKSKISTTGNNDLKEIIYRLYGREVITEIIPIEYEEDGIIVKGYLGEPSQNRSTRNYETYFINNRLIKSKDVSAGIEEGYKAYTMQHKFPFCVLHFSMDTKEIDVNVHPAKKEVRFHNKDLFKKFIANSISKTLLDNEMIANVKIDDSKKETSNIVAAPEPFEENRRELFKEEATNEFNKVKSENDFEIVFEDDEDNENVVDNKDNKDNSNEDFLNSSYNIDSEDVYNNKKSFGKGYIENIFDENDSFEDKISSTQAVLSISKNTIFTDIKIDNPTQMELFEDEKFLSENSRKEYKLIGQIFNTYWIIAFKDKIYFIDQHAAHEKVNYEKLIKRVNENKVESQYMNPPVIITLSPKDKITLENNLPYFEKLGFEIEDMGINEIGLRATPLELYFNSPKDLFLDVLAELSNYPIKDNPEAITMRVATMACKASVKGGMSMTHDEMEVLIDELLKLENPYHCPHGRPTIFAMSKYELEKKFKRVVD